MFMKIYQLVKFHSGFAIQLRYELNGMHYKSCIVRFGLQIFKINGKNY